MALQTFPGTPLLWPTIPFQLFNGGTGVQTVTLNDTTDKLALVATIPVGGTLTDLLWMTGTVTDGDDVIVRIETVSTSGEPTGTLYATNSNGTTTVAASDDSVFKTTSINGGTGVTATRGDVVAVVFALTNSSKTMALRSGQTASSATSLPYTADYNVTGAAAWTRASSSLPTLAAKIGGTWYALGGCNVFNAAGATSLATNAEAGMHFNVPVACVVGGCLFSFDSDNTAAEGFSVILYSDPEGATPVAEATATLIKGYGGSASLRAWYAIFPTAFTASANTDYAIVVKNTGATSVAGMRHFTSDATYVAAYPGGTNGTYYTRTGASGAFSEDTAKIAIMSALIEQVHDGVSAGGGLLTHPGMVGGIRG